jgi:hypothetical protein
MFSINRSRLYAFVLSLSSAILLSSLPYTAHAKEVKQATTEESAEKQVGRKFKTDYNLMQNLMIQLEQVNAEPKTIAVETKGSLQRKRGNKSKKATLKPQKLSDADQKWVEDEIGVKDAAVKKPRPAPAKSFPETKVQKTRLRVRSR